MSPDRDDVCHGRPLRDGTTRGPIVLVVWLYRQSGHTTPDQTGDTMSHTGTARTDGATTRWDGRAADYGRVVSFVNVSKHYGSLKAVDGLSLDLRPGETTALLGPNGAGKSTSLDMLLALRKPTSGQIKLFGSDPYHAVKSGRVGAMLQSGGLMPEVTVRELVTLVTKLHPKPEPIDLTLKRAGVAQFAGQRVDRLSGGQIQRVRFALAICGPITMIVYFGFLILGGIWYPLSGALKTVGQLTPTHQAVKIGTDIIEGASVSMGLAIGLVVWLAIFIGLAVVAVRATAETV